MENERREISIIQLFKVAFGNKRRLIFFTAVIAIIGVLFFHFFYDPGKSEYVADFNYFVAGLNNGTYIDGSAFKFEELVSYSALEAAKASNKDFADIDIDEMYNKNNISITRVKDENNKNVNTVVYLYYRIAVKSKFFKDGDQAKAFISYLAEAPLRKTVELSATGNYMYNLKVFDECESFDTQLSYLNAQLALLDERYDTLIEYYGDVTLSGNDTITDKKKTMDVYFVNNSMSYLRYEKEEYGYVLNRGNNIENLKLKKLDLEKQYKYNEMELEKLEKSISSLMGTVGEGLQTAEINSYNSRITTLISENIEITRQIDNIDLQLKNINNSDNDKYAQKLLVCKGVLESYTDAYRAVEYQVISDNSKVFYDNASIIQGKGGFGLVKGGIIAVILGGVVACCVNLIMDWRKIFDDPFEDEKKNNKQSTGTVKAKRVN